LILSCAQGFFAAMISTPFQSNKKERPFERSCVANYDPNVN
jgi:hypothetical protein